MLSIISFGDIIEAIILPVLRMMIDILPLPAVKSKNLFYFFACAISFFALGCHVDIIQKIVLLSI